METVRYEHGVVHVFIALVVLLALIIAVFLAFVLGLDDVYRGVSSESLFSEDAKISEIRAEIEKRRAQRRAESNVEQTSGAAFVSSEDADITELRTQLQELKGKE